MQMYPRVRPAERNRGRPTTDTQGPTVGAMAVPHKRRDGSLVAGVVLGAVGVLVLVVVVQAVLGAVFGFAAGVAKLVVLVVVVGAVLRLVASRLG